jgi:hypothetical protein
MGKLLSSLASQCYGALSTSERSGMAVVCPEGRTEMSIPNPNPGSLASAHWEKSAGSSQEGSDVEFT